MMRWIFVMTAGIGITACSTAGPFVTQVYPSGPNSLAQQQCTVQFNAFTGIISTGDCSTSTISLVH